MKIPKKQTIIAVLILFATISFSLSQYYSGSYQEKLIKNLGTDIVLLQIRGAMNEYLLRSTIPLNSSNKITQFVEINTSNPEGYNLKSGLWFDKNKNINSYFNELYSFNAVSPSVNNKSWIYFNMPDKVKEQINEEVKNLIADKKIGNVWFVLGIIFSAIAIILSLDIFNRQQ